jgi:DNA-binding MarR family transcriptional regulator
MKIEEAIRQKTPFANEKHKAVVNLIYTANWIEEQMKNFLKPYGLTTQQYNVLRILRGAKEPISTIDIKTRMLDKNSDTSRMIDRMLLKKLVAKCASGEDKRMLEISITDFGLALLSKIDLNFGKVNDKMVKLSESKSAKLNELLDLLRGKY